MHTNQWLASTSDWLIKSWHRACRHVYYISLALVAELGGSKGVLMSTTFKPGDPVVYRKLKYTTHPGPRAKNISPAVRGEHYSYEVDKYWIVLALSEDKRSVVVLTRTGKTHHFPVDHPRLRHATWWERWRYRERFPAISEQVETRALSS